MHPDLDMLGWCIPITLLIGSFLVYMHMVLFAPADTDIWPGGEPRD